MRLVAAALLALPTPLAAAPVPLATYMAQPAVAPSATIAYGPAPSQKVALYLPESKGPFPVVVLLHGGCWIAEFEGLKQTGGIAADLAKRGFAVWNVEYRRIDEPGGGYPGTFQDVATAVDLIRTQAARYRLDPKRVVAVGHSAGAHLALWAASRAKLPRSSALRTANPLRIASVVSLGGVGDMREWAAQSKSVCGLDMPKLAGAPTSTRPDIYADTSPAALLPAHVRVSMIHGESDPIYPPKVGRAYVEQVRKAGDPAELVVIPDAAHFDPVIAGTPAWGIVAARIAREVRAIR